MPPARSAFIFMAFSNQRYAESSNKRSYTT